MPQEKKDSFTFSDKIKNSKAVPSKSFANRVTSKLGSNGKPKKTIFERTKRDAPFFIAALIALLLLPFLYKYSGQVEEQGFITPGADADFVLDHGDSYYGGVIIDNPDGEIAQLAGRDSLSLIKGWGGEPEQTASPALGDYDRNGLEDDYSYTPPSSSSRPVASQRGQAAAQTRAAFRRATTPTKINSLGSASMAGRSGSLAVGPWGGALKESASRVKNSGPRQGPKPVSLQPLQAAGKPSRSYFGMGGAKQARDSKDALSKGNAAQALKDAQFSPINPGVIGGLSGADGQRGGAGANMPNSGSFKGMKPWWWDLMAQRSQHDWLWKRNLWQKPITMLVEEVAKLFANWFGQTFCCLLTGDDGCDVGKFGGVHGKAGSPGKCMKMNEETFKTVAEGKFPFDKNGCKAYCWAQGQDPDFCDKKAWNGGNEVSGDMNFFQVRANCISNSYNPQRKSISLDESSSCQSFAKNGIYKANMTAGMSGWTPYYYVVGIEKNKVSKYYNQSSLSTRTDMLKVFYMEKGTTFKPEDSQKYKEAAANYIPLFVESIAFKKKVGNQGSENEIFAGSLVMNKKTTQTVKRSVKNRKKGGERSTRQVEATESASLPMAYSDFKAIFESGAKTLGKAGQNGKWMKAGRQGKDWVVGAQCEFPLVSVKCPMGTMSNAQDLPYVSVILPGDALDGNLWKVLQDKVSIWYAIASEDKDGNPVYPKTPATGVTKVNHFNAKAFGQQRNPSGRGTTWDSHNTKVTVHSRKTVGNNTFVMSGVENGIPGSTVIDLPIRAVDNPGTGKKVHIVWYVVQNENVNEGKRVGNTEEFDHNNIVSVAECPYYDFEGSQEPVPPLDNCPGDKWKTDESCCVEKMAAKGYEWNGSECVQKNRDISLDGDDDSVIEDTVKVILNSFRCPGSKPDGVSSPYRSGSAGNEKVESAKTMRELFNTHYFACPDCVEELVPALVAKISATIQKSHPNKVVSNQAISSWVQRHKDTIHMATYLSAVDFSSSGVSTKAACRLASQVASWSIDPHARAAGNEGKYDNAFGTFAVYVSPTAAAFFPRAHITEGGSDNIGNPRFNKPAWKRGTYPASVQYLTSLSGDYKYSVYPYTTNPKVVNGIYPLAALVSDTSKYPVLYRNGGSYSSGNGPRGLRAKYKTYGDLLSGQCSNVSAGTVSKENLKKYVQLVCENGLEYKPKGTPAPRLPGSGTNSREGNNQQGVNGENCD